MAKKKASPKPKATTRKPVVIQEIAQPKGLLLALHGMIKASQNDKIAVLEVVREAHQPMNVAEIRDALAHHGVILDEDSVVIHLLFLTDPLVNLVRIVPGSNPHQYEAV